MRARQLRALRGAAAAASATLVAACAHTLAGGGAPSPTIMLVVVVLAAPIAVALVGRARSAWRLALAVAASQLLFHAAFVVTSGARGLDDPAAGAHAHHGVLGVLPAAAGIPGPDVGMLAAHLVAAAVTVMVLRRGEQAVAGIAAGLSRFFSLPPLRAVAAPRVESAPPSPAAPWVLPAPPFRTVLSLRGPPA